METLNVISSPLPFSNFQTRNTIVHGETLEDIVKGVIPPQYLPAVGALVSVNDHIVPRDKWRFVKPKPGTIINIRVIPAGGKGKNPLTAILAIAMMVVAPYIGAYALTALAPMGAGITTTSIAIGGFTITSTMVGSAIGLLVTSALAPPPKSSGSGSVSNPAESPTLFIEGARNTLSAYGVVPVCLGTNRMFMPQAASPFTETQDGEQYVRQLFTYGFGDVVTSQTKIGETLIENFTDVDIERLEDSNLNSGGRLWSNSVLQDNYNVLLTHDLDWVTRSVRPNSNEVIVDYTFIQGLCKFNSAGKRVNQSVKLDIQWRAIGDTEWKGGISYTTYSGDLINSPQVSKVGITRRDIIVINTTTGVISYLNGSVTTTSRRPNIPSGSVKIADVDTVTTRVGFSFVTNITVTDSRDPALFGNVFEDANSFIPTKTGANEITISGGALSDDPLNITNSTSESFVVSHRIVFPQAGNYEIRTKRVTPDTDETSIFDKVNLSSLKGVRYQSPVRANDLSGVALRIKATDQLNGAIDQFNEVVSSVIPEYFADDNVWLPAVTSNPASIYRYILQGPANANPLPDSKIDLNALQEWHTYCVQRGYTCDIVIDYDSSVDDVLRLVASAGSASPAIVDGKRTIVVDRAGKDITQVITPRNSWGYSGEMIYPKMPHAFRVIFRNAEKGYQQDERIVYADGYNASNATLFEQLELRHCTNAALAWKHARRYLASVILRPETHSFSIDVENLVSLRGDRIKFEHDVPLVGIGDGRIKDIILDSAGDVTGLVLDDSIGFPSSGSFYIRIRLSDGSQLYREIVSSAQGYTNNINFVNPVLSSDAPSIGDLCYVTTAGGELDLIITKIEPMADLTAKVTCLNYAPEIFDAETGVIPPFNSNITVPLEFIRPLPPVLIEAQSDESVMIRNIDGTYTSVAVFTLENLNDGDVVVDVKVRTAGASVFQDAKLLEQSNNKVVLSGLDDGLRYDVHIRYKRIGGTMYSIPLQINNYLFVGKSTPPDDVVNFRINVNDSIGLFTWDENDDIDLSHYEIRFSSLTTGATWDTSQVLESRALENRISLTAQSGTYLIKAVDLSGNYSVNPALISTFGLEGVVNSIAELEEDPDFIGTHVNTVARNGNLYIADTDLGEGYYYFHNNIDLTEVYTSIISSSIIANGTFQNNIFTMDDIFASADLFGVGDNDLFGIDDIFAMPDVFGIGAGAWEVQLQVRFTNDNPTDTGANWTDWQNFTAGNNEFRGAEFRLYMQTFDKDISPVVSKLSVSIDMPDRIERGEDLTVLSTGAQINFSPAFKDIPALSILLQNGDAGDEIEFIRKDATGFEFKVYNRVSMSYVERIYDFIASGYGRVIS